MSKINYNEEEWLPKEWTPKDEEVQSECKQKTRADHVREKVEALKAFDVVHELRGINTEQDMGCADALPLDMVVEKLKPFHDALASALDQLLMMVEDLETKTTGDYLIEQLLGEETRKESPPIDYTEAAIKNVLSPK